MTMGSTQFSQEDEWSTYVSIYPYFPGAEEIKKIFAQIHSHCCHKNMAANYWDDCQVIILINNDIRPVYMW